MIELKGLGKMYGDTAAVSEVSFEVKPKEIFGFLGPNGAGKSTTLRMLAGYLAPSSGTACLAGYDIQTDNLEVRRNIGYLPENNPLYEEMDVSEYLEWTAHIRGFKGRDCGDRVRSSVEACDLGDVLDRKIDYLSKGFRQRVGLAAAILHDPKILLLDEPTSGLDPNQAREVRQLIMRLKEEKTVMISTHILPEVEASCDRVVILHRGAVAAEGTPADLIRGASGGQSVHLTLKSGKHDPETVKIALLENPGVTSAEVSVVHDEIRACIESGNAELDLREPLFKLAVRKRWVLLEMRQKSASLENVFSELTLE